MQNSAVASLSAKLDPLGIALPIMINKWKSTAVVCGYALGLGLFRFALGELRDRREQARWWLRAVCRFVATAMVEAAGLRVCACAAGCASTYFENVVGRAPAERAASTEGVVLVTGATSGIGRATAAELVRRGYDVIVPARDVAKAERLAAEIGARALPVPLELSDQASVRAYAEALREQGPLTTLVLNAGVMRPEQATSVDGAEMTMASNHLGHHTLTSLLLPELRASAEEGYDCRIVAVSSCVHRMTDVLTRDDASLDFNPVETGYSMFPAYARSKLANVLWTQELARRTTGIACISLHPGVVYTGINRDLPWYLRLGHGAIFRLLIKSPEHGARTTLHAVLAPDLAASVRAGPIYLEDCVQVDPATASAPDRAATVARDLWDASEAYASRARSTRILL